MLYYQDCQPYCEACYAAAVLPKCDNCSKPIVDRVLSVKDFNNKEVRDLGRKLFSFHISGAALLQ